MDFSGGNSLVAFLKQDVIVVGFVEFVCLFLWAQNPRILLDFVEVEEEQKDDVWRACERNEFEQLEKCLLKPMNPDVIHESDEESEEIVETWLCLLDDPFLAFLLIGL